MGTEFITSARVHGFPEWISDAVRACDPMVDCCPQAPGPAAVRPITPTAVGATRTDTLIDFTIDDTKPVVAHATATVYVLNTGRVARGLGRVRR